MTTPFQRDQDRPYIGRVWISPWITSSTQEKLPGIKLGGVNGIAAHLTAEEAFQLSDKLTDLAEQLVAQSTAQSVTAAPQRPAYSPALARTRSVLNASYTDEPELPTTAPDLE